MPCCWPATAMARTSSSSPAEVASSYAAHHAAGSTSVPSGCAARPSRTTAPVDASQTTTLVDCVDESTPATSTKSLMDRVRPARQSFEGGPRADLVQRVEPARVGLREPLVRRQVAEQLFVLHEGERLVALSCGRGHDPLLELVDDLDRFALLVDALGVAGPRRDDEGRPLDLPALLQVGADDGDQPLGDAV